MLYDNTGAAYWASGTSNTNGQSTLRMQNDSNLVLHYGDVFSTPIWSSLGGKA